MKDLVTWNTHVQYESPITSALKAMTKVKVFVHQSHANADTDTGLHVCHIKLPGHICSGLLCVGAYRVLLV